MMCVGFKFFPQKVSFFTFYSANAILWLDLAADKCLTLSRRKNWNVNNFTQPFVFVCIFLFTYLCIERWLIISMMFYDLKNNYYYKNFKKRLTENVKHFIHFSKQYQLFSIAGRRFKIKNGVSLFYISI
jgi:hypothetical protein